ncbi:daf-6 [Cordylochernes scorpioides]|uniref:Daf-6 n=1 Tax=Cordylochernes scorpioides TaxID=51811 RepID=A0ABY6LP21_9ARAC|nr:daf-6 [Cordylochernes scorpioides]
MDDVYVMLEAWKRSDPERTVAQRMGETMEHAGISITISSLTNCICFLIGAAAPLKFSYYFCMYAAACVFFDYVLTVSVVGAVIVLLARGEARPLHAVLFIPFDTAAKLCKNKTIYNFIFYRENPDKSSTTYKSSNFSNAFAKFTTSCTTSSRGRSIIFTFYIMYLAVSLWGTVNIKEDFKETDVFFHESYLHDQFKSFYEYFNDYHMRIHLVIEEPIPYWEPKTQETLKNFTVEVENLPFMTGENLTESWIRYYSNFINANQNFFRTDYTNRKVFIYNLRNFYLKINPYKSYYHDIVFNKNYTEIIASRIFVQTSKVNKTSDLRYVVNSLREVAARYPYKISVYHPFFWVADHLNKVAWITTTSLSTAVVILLVISLIFIPSIKFCLITGFAIISIQIGVLGLSSLWSVDLNNLTNVSLIISVGFSIDNISHVLSSYYSSKKTRCKG